MELPSKVPNLILESNERIKSMYRNGLILVTCSDDS